jgi:hypothetical protein
MATNRTTFAMNTGRGSAFEAHRNKPPGEILVTE